MADLDLKFPDWSNHPPAPHLSLEHYEAWIIGMILPRLDAAGKLTREESLLSFKNREGAMKEPFVLHED